MTHIRQRPIKVLIVDDNASMRLLERLMLEREPDFCVVEARDGQEAVAQALAVQPDVILMDIMMPQLNGIAACRQLRLTPETAVVPVIIISANTSTAWREAAVLAGAQAFLMKPLTRSNLLQTIWNVLGLHHPSAPAEERLVVRHDR